jgi:G:T-mismatch repair DNA endonuclease (very short patch repair protein)
MNLKPNNKELQLGTLLDSLYPKQFRYVGDGQIIIDGCVPDFIDCNHRKLALELFGTYWHGLKKTGLTREEAEQQRIDRFAKYGYSTLIVWEHELKQPEVLKEKIIKFVG